MRSHRIVLAGLLGVAAAAGAGAWAAAPAKEAASNVLTAKEKKQGWKLLFDGKSTEGWRGYKKQEVPPSWKVEGGALVRDGKGAGDLVTVDEYGDFELALEWKIAEGGNSGIMYRVVEGEGAPFFSGPEMQIADPKNSDGPNPMTAAGSCYDLYPVSKNVVLPSGQWNRVRLLARGGHIEHWLNDVKVTEYEIGSADWQKRVTASKFHQWPQFAKAARGHIDLQDHAARIEFRNIKIRAL